MRMSALAVLLSASYGNWELTSAYSGSEPISEQNVFNIRDSLSYKQDTAFDNHNRLSVADTLSSSNRGPVSTLPIEIREHLALALHPSGRHADEVARQQAIEWLVARTDEIHPHLLEWLRREPEGPSALAILDLLPAFAKPEAVPILRSALASSDEYVAEIAGKALGRHPAPVAEAALAAALMSQKAHIVAAAADGFLLRGDQSACETLLAALPQSDPIARYHVIRAASRLGCLSEQQLVELASNDEDPDIRRLARSFKVTNQRKPYSPSDSVGESKGEK